MTFPESGAARTFPEPLLAFPSFLMFQLLREARRIIGTLDDQGLRLPHLGVLSCLAEFGPAAQKDISTRLRIDASDLVSVLDDLERTGLVRRERDQRDRRRYTVTMTTAGTAALEGRMAATRVLDERLLQPLTEPERAQLHRLLLRAYAHHDPDRLPPAYR
ncbi:MAG TPA: MarR family transcriptional regulator [Pseudonocardiaceae bacterium]|jgi:DNA-binding MarR family transcriptional regulator|nr:MarR family transcriptional regulator [Pseudonocardiaceae bacterium]